ncbi:Mitochondrial carrier family protein [Leishmania donovani]|uniref:Mitochondrial carrier family protein n=2 Tax=Leishmania donovani TaxID=5661 RepID=A0A504XET4_LEIDO|nr:Mitochondrial carrier family protein [Leishmania donovani]
MEVVCSALAGIFARLLCHPLDTIKTVTFTGFAGDHLAPPATAASSSTPAPRASFLQSARSIWAREGVAGFYRGVGVAAVGSAPGVALYLSTYDWCSTAWKAFGDGAAGAAGSTGTGENSPVPGVMNATLQSLRAAAAATPPSVRFFVCGLAAETVSCVVWVPIDVAKERLQSQPPSLKGRYTSSLDALQRILANEGVRGLYKGYASTLSSFGPFSAVYFVFYEYFTKVLAGLHTAASAAPKQGDRNGGNEREIFSLATFAVALGAGAGGNAVASLLTNPLELVKTRIQVQRAVLHRRDVGASTPALFSYHYRGLREGLGALAKEKGIRALWKGVGSRIAYSAPNAALTMGFFEFLKTKLI